MSRMEKLNALSNILCGVDSIEDCLHCHEDKCIKFGSCKLKEKTDDQIEYILSSVDKCIYLEACAGSGKTEVLGIKAAYEISRWNLKNSGIAVLTFTNDAAATILERVSMFYNRPIPSIHFIGTFSSFIHGYISQKFGYKFFQDKTAEKDKSFCIVDSATNRYSSHWLQNYAVDFPISSKSKLFANQLNYHSGSKAWFIGIGENRIPLIEQYDSQETQKLIMHIRKKNKKYDLFRYDYLCKKVVECKKKFWKAGFATFEDMNLIAIKCLTDRNICTYLSKRFPLIFVDECQDLSKNELLILALLIKAGTKVHYIGDLHQAIYSFKDACPEHYTAHINKYSFETLNLIDNFRSTQNIVDVSCNIASISNHITGKVKSKHNGDDCFYIEYTDEKEAISIFEALLIKYGILIDNAVVLVRTQNAKAKFTQNNSNYDKHPIISALQLWKNNTPRGKNNALRLVGGQLQKWLGFQGRSNNFYYPPDLCSDAVAWRLMLRDLLSDLCADESICNLSGITYSDWYRSNKKQIAYIINSYTHKMIGLDLSADRMKAPSGTAKLTIEKIIEEKPISSIKVETVHAVKGRTFDAVLLLSSPDGRGKTGYWENWLDPSDEASRIGYVACTRPKSLLCWGVSTLNDTQRRTIENLGLKNISHKCYPYS